MISWAFQQKLSPTEKLVLIALADHANDEDFTCWPSLTHLVKKTCLSRKTVWKAIDKLADKGLVKRVNDPTKRSTTYYLIGAEGTYPRYTKNPPQVPTSPRLGSYGTPNHNRTVSESKNGFQPKRCNCGALATHKELCGVCHTKRTVLAK